MSKGTTYEQRLEHENRCTARRQDGKPCGSYAIRGGVVCRRHGGSAPQVRAAAQRRLAAMAIPATDRLGHFAFDNDVPPPVGLAATNSILDRAGLGAKQAVGVEVTVAPWEQLLGDVAHMTKAQHDAIYHPERAAPAGPQALPPAAADIVDAEVVDPPVAHPERARDRAGAPIVPDWAEPPPATPPSRDLVTMEDAAAEVAAANRTAVTRARRRR